MMRKNTGSIIFILILCFSVAGITVAENTIVDSMDFQGEVSLSLEEAINVMLKDNPTFKESELDLEQAEVDYDQGKKALRKAEKIFKDKEEDSASYLKNVKLLELSTEFGIENSKRNHEATIESLKAEVEEAYFRLLQAEQQEEINKVNVETAKDLHEKTKKKFELGLIAKQEVINSELSLITAENEYKSAQYSVKNAKMNLNTKLANDLMTDINLKDELKYEEFELESIAEAISKALINRNEIKSAEFNYEIEKINMEVTRKEQSEITFDYRNQVVKLEKAEKTLMDGRRNIEMEVRANYLDVLQKQEEIKAGEKSVELAEEALRLSQLSYDVGMSVLTDVQKAQTTLLQSKLGLSNSILNYNLSVMKFEDCIGIGRTSMASGSSAAAMGGGY